MITLPRALALLGLDTVLFLAIGLWLRSDGNPVGEGLLWGLVGGLLCAVSAVGGAWWAEIRNFSTQQALAVVVVGMLGRMIFLAAWALLAIKVGEVDMLGFLAGFAALYLVGQLLEVLMLARRQHGQPS